jgi:hypothetical protein
MPCPTIRIGKMMLSENLWIGEKRNAQAPPWQKGRKPPAVGNRLD